MRIASAGLGNKTIGAPCDLPAGMIGNGTSAARPVRRRWRMGRRATKNVEAALVARDCTLSAVSVSLCRLAREVSDEELLRLVGDMQCARALTGTPRASKLEPD